MIHGMPKNSDSSTTWALISVQPSKWTVAEMEWACTFHVDQSISRLIKNCKEQVHPLNRSLNFDSISELSISIKVQGNKGKEAVWFSRTLSCFQEIVCVTGWCRRLKRGLTEIDSDGYLTFYRWWWHLKLHVQMWQIRVLWNIHKLLWGEGGGAELPSYFRLEEL